jgi:hypothetical protein
MKFELANCTRTLLDEVARKEAKRLDIAKTYGLALRSSYPTDWRAVNEAIINRWSMSALEWIKKQAWSGRAFA